MEAEFCFGLKVKRKEGRKPCLLGYLVELTQQQ
jgi:hypothetical protein